MWSAAWRTIRGELEAYGEGLADRPEILALNKVDALDADERKAKAKALKKAAGVAPHLISGVSGEGVQDVLRDRLPGGPKAHRAGEAAAAAALVDAPAADQPSGWSPV
jgi:GTP-binding protein